jgi:hypothetical protein
LLIGVVNDRAAGIFEPDHVITTRYFRVPIGSLDEVEVACDVNFLQLIDQHDGGIPV